MQDIIHILAAELNVQPRQVQAAVELLDGGATVPFIARYRKEATGALDDIVLRELDVRLVYLRELQERRAVVSQTIAQQGKLSPALQASIEACSTKQALEDLYLPYKLKRRTKGQMAIEAGLEPLANALFANPTLVPEQAALAYVIESKPEEPGIDKAPDFSSVSAVLDGVRDILSERWAQQPALVHDLREWMWSQGLLCSTLLAGKNEETPEVAKFRDYFDYSEAVSRIPSHRALAVFRGRALDVLDIRLDLPDNSAAPAAADPKALPAAALQATARMASLLGWRHQNRAADDLIRKCLLWAWRVKLSLSTERDVLSRLREAAEKVAIKVFADNLRDRLLAAPAGPRVVLGLDPGIRTGVKVAVVDATGKLVETATVFPHEPRRDWDGALHTLAALSKRHGVNLIAIGNGTASRETDKLASDLIKQLDQSNQGAHLKIDKVVVSEAGASVYSASEYASKEMPDVDVSLRGAASIARRLQDPLAELVKIDPKAIGVGQYQHDVNQSELARTLDAVVEDCVNAVGVDINTASTALLGRVSGVSPTVAQALVGWREAHGAFASRQDLLQVAGLGRKTFEQCAGFLRIRGGSNPLDMTGVHPETYPVVEKIIAATGKPVAELMGRAEMLKSLKPELFANATFGVITVKDILLELEKPGRDPRGSFQVAKLNDSVMDLADLKVGMVLEGTVSNVAAFGAFVDLGVHQDGLVHVSQLAHKFVADAREAVKTGDVVKVQVLEVDLARKRIALTMKLGAVPGEQASRSEPRPTGKAYSTKPAPVNTPSAMASAFAKLGR
jgi:protein Tex